MRTLNRPSRCAGADEGDIAESSPPDGRFCGHGRGAIARSLARLRRRWRRVKDVVAPELQSYLLAFPLPHPSRRTVRLLRRMPIPGLAVPGVRCGVTEAVVPGRKPAVMHVYTPEGEVDGPRGALVWIHGGGFVFGTPAMGHHFCSPLLSSSEFWLHLSTTVSHPNTRSLSLSTTHIPGCCGSTTEQMTSAST